MVNEKIIYINNKKFIFTKDLTILQAAELMKIEIPRFCYHKKLAIAGNCRMCLVELKKSVKPVASCAMSIINNMEIFTNTALVKKAREGILEFLLANHPLDCPICDQGGECDLQDISYVFGSDRGRFYEKKRAVFDKYAGPFIKTLMTRCIHCTRCIRFLSEVGGNNSLGLIGRGYKMKVNSYIKNYLIDSEVSGNIIDLCPVGALTSVSYSFKSRPWEIKNINSIDLTDSIGSNIRIDYRGFEILRVLPKYNNEINDEWISNKIRFLYDSFNSFRINECMYLNNHFLLKCDWEDAFFFIKTYLLKKSLSFIQINGYLGNILDFESLIFFKDFLMKLNNNSFLKLEENFIKKSFNLRRNFLINNLDINNDDNANYYILVGTNLRLEAPILNIKFRNNYLKKKIIIGNIGFNYKGSFYYYNLGNNYFSLLKIFEGRHWFLNFLKKNDKINVLFGSSFLEYKFKGNFSFFIDFINNNILYNHSSMDSKNFINFGFLQKTSSSLNFFESGNVLNNKNYFFRSKLSNNKKFNNINFFLVYLLNVNNFKIIVEKYVFFKKKFNISFFLVYQGHFNLLKNIKYDNIESLIILPNFTFLEKEGSFLNYKGVLQKTTKLFLKRNNLRFNSCRSNFEIFVNLYFYIKSKNLYKNAYLYKESFNDLRLLEISPKFLNKKELISDKNTENFQFLNKTNYKKINKNYLFNNLFYSKIENFYKTDILTNNSLNLMLSHKIIKNSSYYYKNYDINFFNNISKC